MLGEVPLPLVVELGRLQLTLRDLAGLRRGQVLELGRGAEVRRCLYTNYCEGLDQKHVEVTCQLWDRAFDDPAGPGAPRSADGKRRLEPPAWER